MAPSFYFGLCLVTAATMAASVCGESATEPPMLDWHTVSPADVDGKAWQDTKGPFDRLPARAEGVVRPPVWELAGFPSGLSFRFRSNATSIHLKWTVTSERLAMNHMPATGVSGLDLYRRRGGQWHFLAVARPIEFPTNEALLIEGLNGDDGEYRMYMPLYNGVKDIAVGVPRGVTFEILAPDPKTKPVVFYGTSITHGGCASRPGMTYPAILGRRLGAPVVNLGFSGNGKAEPEVATLLSEIDAAAMVLDPVPNLFAQDVHDRIPKFLEIIRSGRPQTPIVLVESPIYPDTAFVASRAKRVADSNKFLREAFQARVAQGDRWLTLVPGCDMSVDGGECTVDGVHPTDWGFIRMADNLEGPLKAALD